jgi:hypothetical protein
MWAALKLWKVIGGGRELKPYTPPFLKKNGAFLSYYYMYFYIKPNLNSYKVLNNILQKASKRQFNIATLQAFLIIRSFVMLTGIPFQWVGYLGRVVKILEKWLGGYKITIWS